MGPNPKQPAMEYEPPNDTNQGETTRGLMPGSGRGGICGDILACMACCACLEACCCCCCPRSRPAPLFAQPASPAYATSTKQPAVAMTPLAQERIEMHQENRLAKQERKEEHQQAKDERKAEHQQAKDERKDERVQRKEERKDERVQRHEERRDEKVARKEERRDERVQHVQARQDGKGAGGGRRK